MPPRLCHLDYVTSIMPPRLCQLDYATSIVPPRLCHLDCATSIVPPRLCHLDYTTLITPPWLHHLHYTTLITPPWLHFVTTYYTLWHLTLYYTLVFLITLHYTSSHRIAHYYTLLHLIKPNYTLVHLFGYTLIHLVAPCHSLSHLVAPCCTLLHLVAPCCTLLHLVAPWYTLVHLVTLHALAHPRRNIALANNCKRPCFAFQEQIPHYRQSCFRSHRQCWERMRWLRCLPGFRRFRFPRQHPLFLARQAAHGPSLVERSPLSFPWGQLPATSACLLRECRRTRRCQADKIRKQILLSCWKAIARHKVVETARTVEMMSEVSQNDL